MTVTAATNAFSVSAERSVERASAPDQSRMYTKPLVAAFVVALLCSSALAGAAAAQSEPTAANETTTLTETENPDPMGITSSPVPGFGAVTAVLALAAGAMVARASSRRR